MKKYFTLIFDEEYPSGRISTTKELAEELKSLGWDVSFHTDYYMNCLGAEFQLCDNVYVGFGGWIDSLDAFVETIGNDGYQNAHKEYRFKSQEDLDKFVDLINKAIELNKILKSI